MNFEKKVLERVESLTKTINDVLPKNTDYILDFDNEQIGNKIINVFDKNNKKILSVNYELLGTYDPRTKIFNWGCNKNIVDKQYTKLSKVIKSKSKKIKKYIITKKYEDVIYLETLYYYLTNKIFFVNDITKLIKYCIYASKTKGILMSIDTQLNGEIHKCYLITDIISF